MFRLESFKPTITTNENTVLTFRYKRTLFRWIRCSRGNVCWVASIRAVFLVALLILVCITAGFYSMDKKTFTLPNDGDPVNWIVRFGNIVALIVMIYFLLSVICAQLVTKVEDVSESNLLWFLQILYICAMPLTCLSFTEYFSKVYVDSTVIKGEEATIITTFCLMLLDFIPGTQYIAYEWAGYPLVVLNAYIILLMLCSAIGGITVYPSLPFLNDPGYALVQSLVVNVVFLVLYFVIAFITQWRYQKWVDGINSSQGAYNKMSYKTKNNILTEDTLDHNDGV